MVFKRAISLKMYYDYGVGHRLSYCHLTIFIILTELLTYTMPIILPNLPLTLVHQMTYDLTIN